MAGQELDLRARLRAGPPCMGTIVTFSDPTATEAVAGGGLDFVWIDMEHAPLDIERVQGHVMAARLGGAAALVRVPANDPVAIKRVLDCGADGVIVPMVSTPEEARRAVAACRYPPAGVRGFGPRRAAAYGREPGDAYCARADAEVLVVVQIEHVDAARNLDAILDVPGLDAVIVGPADLSASLGLLPRTTHPEVAAVIAGILATAQARGLPAGIFVGDPAQARRWIAQGARLVCLGADYTFLVQALDQALAAVRAEEGA